MNPSSKGWLREYLLFYKEHRQTANKPIFSDETFYQLISRSSLLFSIPLEKSENLHPDFAKWNVKEKIKIVFTEHLFQVSEMYITNNKYVLDISDVHNRLLQLSEKKQSTEQFIDNIIQGKKDSLLLNAYNINPWAFLYLIKFYFLLKQENIDFYKFKLDIIKGMYKAAKADNNISKKETRLLKRFIENTPFKQKDKDVLYKYSKVKIFESNFSNSPRIIKKISYDFALLALMTDKKLNESELVFVNKYANQLGISLEEQYHTFSLIQDIHLNHYPQIPHLHRTYSIKSIRSIVTHNFKYVLKKNIGMIVNEISESKELLLLIRKSTDEKLSETEKAKVKEQILDLLKTIPSLTIFMIPGGSILLPILIKILPKELIFPSSFINKGPKNN